MLHLKPLWRQPSKAKLLPQLVASFSLAQPVILQLLYFSTRKPLHGRHRRILDATSRPATTSEKIRNSQFHFAKVMTLLCSLQPKLEVKNSVLPFTAVVSACGITIVWLRHCFLYFYVHNIVNLEKEGSNNVSAAHGRLKRKSTAYLIYTSQQPGLGLALGVPGFCLHSLPDATVKFPDLNIRRTRAIIYQRSYYFHYHYLYSLTCSSINN